MYKKEACVQSLKEAKNAEINGADAIEVCIDLHEDGLSPPPIMIENILSEVNIPIKVMVRSRPGSFIYSNYEVEEMIRYIKQMNKYNIAGFVFGALNNDYNLDYKVISAVAEVAEKPITIHKCIDLATDPIKEIQRLKKIIGVSSILSSGKEATALEGISLLQQMLETCGDDLSLIVAGKVTMDNIDLLHKEIGAQFYHGRRIVGNL